MPFRNCKKFMKSTALENYHNSLTISTMLKLLGTKIINYANNKLVYYDGNFNHFKKKLNL